MTWCYLPDTASPSAQAAADLTWVLTLPSRALPPPVSSSGRNTLDQFSSPHSAPDTSPRPRSGTTCEPLTADRGAGSVTLSLPDTHASRFPPRDSERAKKTPAIFGLTLPGSSERFSQSGSFLRTFRDTSPLALKPCCEPYGTWASRLRLAYSRRLKSARRMKGSGFSSWPTATAHSFAQTADDPTPGQTGGTTLAGAAELQWQTPVSDDAPDRSKGKINSRGEPKLSGQAIIWGTPRASDAEKGGPNQAFGAGGIPLPAQAAKWTTPSASDGKRGGTGITEGMSGSILTQNVAQWPTPQSRDLRMGGSPDSPRRARKMEQGWSQNLNDLAETWPTPAAQNVKGSSEGSITRADGKSRMDILHYRAEQGFSRPAHLTLHHGPTLSQLRPIWRQLRASLIASHGRAVWRRLWTRRDKARLNPAFVGWLMGWPPGHANCACSETAWFLWQRDMRGALSALPTAYGAWIWQPPAPKKAAPMQGDLFAEAAADQWGAWAMGVA